MAKKTTSKPKAKAKEEKKPKEEKAPTSILDGNIDEIIDMIITGDNYRKISAHFDVSLGALHRFLHLDEHTARTREALKFSASTYADQGEQALMDIEPEATRGDIARQTGLSQHYRWAASKRSPNEYGDKLDLSNDGGKFEGGPTINISSNGDDIDLSED